MAGSENENPDKTVRGLMKKKSLPVIGVSYGTPMAGICVVWGHFFGLKRIQITPKGGGYQ